jgi:hypothetical protein
VQDEVIFGRKEQGKSTISFYRARLQSKDIVIWDACCQYPVFPAAHTPKQLERLLQLRDDDGQFITPIAYQPAGEPKDNFPAFAAAIWKCKRRPIVVIVDEASELQTASNMEPSLSRLVRQGHRYGIAVIQNTHRPPDVHRRSWALASIYIFFRTTDELDLERIKEHCGEEVAGHVSKLARFHCVIWNEDKQTYELWTDPSKWYVDIHGKDQPDREMPIAPPNLTAEEQEQVNA